MFIFGHLVYCVCCVRAMQPCQRWRCFYYLYDIFTLFSRLFCQSSLCDWLNDWVKFTCNHKANAILTVIRLYSGETQRNGLEKGFIFQFLHFYDFFFHRISRTSSYLSWCSNSHCTHIKCTYQLMIHHYFVTTTKNKCSIGFITLDERHNNRLRI